MPDMRCPYCGRVQNPKDKVCPGCGCPNRYFGYAPAVQEAPIERKVDFYLRLKPVGMLDSLNFQWSSQNSRLSGIVVELLGVSSNDLAGGIRAGQMINSARNGMVLMRTQMPMSEATRYKAQIESLNLLGPTVVLK